MLLIRHFRLLLFLSIAAVIDCQCLGAQEIESSSRLQAMRARSAGTSISFRDQLNKGDITMLSSPLFRYSDEQRAILDGSFWCWASEGRPVAFQKVENYRSDDAARQWLCCFASASPNQIDVAWKSGQSWMSQKPGITWMPLRSGTKVSTPREFSVESKRLARKYSVTLYEDTHRTQEQLRFLSRPIYEYQTTDKNRGAVFGIATGTNPDALLILEVSESGDAAEWKSAWIQMTMGRLISRVGEEEVWTAPYRTYAGVGKFESWLFFFEDPNSSY